MKKFDYMISFRKFIDIDIDRVILSFVKQFYVFFWDISDCC